MCTRYTTRAQQQALGSPSTLIRARAFRRCTSSQRSEVTGIRFTTPCALRPRTHQQRLTLMSSPTTLDAPPTPFRAASQASGSMLVNWLSFLTPSCCHSLNFANSASTPFWCLLVVSRTCCSPRISSKILRSPRACRSAARSPYRAFLPTAQYALGVGLLLHGGGRSPPSLPAAAPRRWWYVVNSKKYVASEVTLVSAFGNSPVTATWCSQYRVEVLPN